MEQTSAHEREREETRHTQGEISVMLARDDFLRKKETKGEDKRHTQVAYMLCSRGKTF